MLVDGKASPDTVTVRPAGPACSDFVRAIVAPPAIVPRTRRLTFTEAVGDSLRDARGAGTGLTHRLPGTGFKLPVDDVLVPAVALRFCA